MLPHHPHLLKKISRVFNFLCSSLQLLPAPYCRRQKAQSWAFAPLLTPLRFWGMTQKGPMQKYGRSGQLQQANVEQIRPQLD